MDYSTQQKRSQSLGGRADAKAKVNTQQKRSQSQGDRADDKAKAKAKTSKGDEVVIDEPTAKTRARSTSRKGTTQERDNPEGAPRREQSRPPPEEPTPPEFTSKYQEGGASSSSTNPTAKPAAKDAAKPKKTVDKDKKPPHNTTKDTDTRPGYWNKQNKAYILDQLTMHYGVKFDTTNKEEYKKQLQRPNLLKLIKEKVKSK
jgi:hypothetical protein